MGSGGAGGSAHMPEALFHMMTGFDTVARSLTAVFSTSI
jgi:hypothetical protein